MITLVVRLVGLGAQEPVNRSYYSQDQFCFTKTGFSNVRKYRQTILVVSQLTQGSTLRSTEVAILAILEHYSEPYLILKYATHQVTTHQVKSSSDHRMSRPFQGFFNF